ncbi:hypothetical protein [Mesorhizobium sp. L2C067A000]|uniref:hypothetical protein n=1 Tax=Mesorhizobium sp. L2C067A000 TaxID=1287106 RepID=UPI0003D03DDF|nr:hypothetical protein [Mesorhizobium sp. L2C067A000]ESZ23709.1 hypothetical protein X733_33025 [Mesorhizobium sp. L2C067A000]
MNEILESLTLDLAFVQAEMLGPGRIHTLALEAEIRYDEKILADAPDHIALTGCVSYPLLQRLIQGLQLQL